MSVTQQPDNKLGKWSREALRERAISDFRDFRFTWTGFFRWAGLTVLAVLIAAIATLYFLDWNQMRVPVGRYLSQRSGQEVRIDGHLAVKLFSWQPSVDAGGIYVGNPKMGRHGAGRKGQTASSGIPPGAGDLRQVDHTAAQGR